MQHKRTTAHLMLIAQTLSDHSSALVKRDLLEMEENVILSS